jgi:broad specificity phosphatase PhoE
MSPKDSSETAQSEITLQLAKKEHAEHMEGMDEAAANMIKRPLIVNAYALDDPNAPTGENVKTCHFVRHGQGFHNLMADVATSQGRTWVPVSLDGAGGLYCRDSFVLVCVVGSQFAHICLKNSKTPENPYYMFEILDAPLTEKGRQQALVLQPRVQAIRDQPELVAFSPNCRALQTGVLVFEHLVGKVPFLAHEMVREGFGVHLCDQRRPTSRQTAEFPMVDFSLLETEEDVLFLPDRRETKPEIADRAYKFLEWLSARPEKHIGVASHSAWLLTLFNANLRCDESLRGWFQTGEMRSAILEFTEG